jgi:ferredoxin
MAKACVGCGILSDAHPVVAIMNQADVPEGVTAGQPGPYGFVAVPTCKECHENPEHRVRPIKGHFAYAKDEAAFVARAGSNVDGGKIGG